MTKCCHVRNSRKARLTTCASAKVFMTVKMRSDGTLGIIDMNDPHMGATDYGLK